MVVPKSEKNNLDVVEIAEQYYKVCYIISLLENDLFFKECKAKQNSGKTIWIGAMSKVNMNEWKIIGGNWTGKSVGYTNWKDASPSGNCAYLFTKVIRFIIHTLNIC